MPQNNIRPLSETVTAILPKRWAETPKGRNEQMAKIQSYLAAEAEFGKEIPEEKRFGVSWMRGLLMADIGSFYGLFNPFDAIKDWMIRNITDPITDAISGLLDRWPLTLISDIYYELTGIGSTIYDWAKSAIEDTVGGIVSTAEDIWNTIEGIGQTIWNQAYDAVSSAISGIVSAAGDIWNAVKDFGSKVWNAAKGALEAVIDPLWSILEGIKRFFGKIWSSLSEVASTIGTLPQKIWNGLTTLGSYVQQIPSKIWEGLQTLGGWIKQIPGKMWEGMKKLGGWIYEGLSAAFGWLQEEAWPWFRNTMDALWDAVQSGVNWIAGRVMDAFHAVVHTFANFSHIMTDAIAGGFKKVLTVITKPLADFYQWTMQEMIISPLKGLRGEGGTIPGIPTLVDTVGDIAEELYTTLRDGIEYEPPATFEKAQDAAGDFLTYGLVFGGMDSIVTMAEEIWDKLRGFAGGVGSDIINKFTGYAETINPFQQYPKAISGSTASHFGGIAKFFKSTYYALGLGFMMWTIWSGSLRAIMADPREEYYRRVYKTKYPEPSTFKKAFEAQMTLPNSNESWLSTAGYSPMYRDMIKQLSWNRLSEGQAKELWNRGLINETTLEEELKWKGYRREIMPKIVENAKIDALQDKMDNMSDAYEEAYEVGTVSYNEALKKLQGYGYSEKKAEYTLKSIDKERTADFREDVVDELVDLLEDGEITEEKFMREASKFIVQPHLLQRYMMLAAIERGDIGQIGTVGPVNQRIDQLKHRIENLSNQIDRLVDERSEQREIYEERIKALKGEISRKNELTDAEAKVKIEKLREKMEERGEKYGEQIRNLREEREELQLDLEAMEGYAIAG